MGVIEEGLTNFVLEWPIIYPENVQSSAECSTCSYFRLNSDSYIKKKNLLLVGLWFHMGISVCKSVAFNIAKINILNIN